VKVTPCKHNRTYGLRFSNADRDSHLLPEWTELVIWAQGNSNAILVNLAKPSFWRHCPEVFSKEFESWLHHQGLLPWPKGHPPKLSFEHRDTNHFYLRPVFER